jgi:hypothetical protein
MQFKICTLSTILVIALTWSPVTGRVMWSAMVGQQSCDRSVNDEHNVATVTTVTAVRTPKWLELLTVHR